MDNHAQPDAASLEDRLRRMILLNGSVPDDSSLASRLGPPSLPPPSNPRPLPTSEPPSPYAQPWSASDSPSPASPHRQALPPPTPPRFPTQQLPRFLPPHVHNHAPPQAPHHHHQSHHPVPHSRQYAAGAPPPGPQQGRGGFRGGGQRGGGSFRQQRSQQIHLDPEAFQRGASHQGHGRPPPTNRNLYNPNARTAHHPPVSRDVVRQRQAEYLDDLAAREISTVDMSQAERDDKSSFRIALEHVCHRVCEANPSLPRVSLQCFGSFESGFASAGSDMDLVIVVEGQAEKNACFSLLADDLPRVLEQELLRVGFGARLLTRTRVPIIKICQHPGDCLLDKLRAERERWDSLPNETKYPHLHREEDETAEDDVAAAAEAVTSGDVAIASTEAVAEKATSDAAVEKATVETTDTQSKRDTVTTNGAATGQNSKRDAPKTWTRERKAGPLDFPKDGVGIQCDINFFNPLGLHNTQMLRCYSKCDPRVRPMVLFVKSWAKGRKINSSYSGTLSSYGYVLMVLHYLMNVVQPPVLPNLQMPWRPHAACTPPGATRAEVDGWVVDFWRNEDEIEQALQMGQMSSNKESLGSLLAGFLQYYSSMGNGPQFRWTQQVLSLRTPGGILTKDAKGWVKATTEEGEGKKIQHRYLFCIEDPFELDHNVARTVTHNGIVAIRDEFRRAFRILLAVGNGNSIVNLGELCDKLIEDGQEELAMQRDIAKRNNEILGIKDGAPEQFGGPQEQEILKKKLSNAQQHSGQPRNTNNQKRQRSQGQQPRPKPKPLDTDDQGAFPTLGAAKDVNPRRKKSGSVGKGTTYNEIAGDQAAAYLEEFRRKKAEAQAETTAFGAAEMVLNGDD
ncbi:uncharacterized protein MYCFIDRAFT_87561 [Pseudocercospora fijiensis CIRAD86]|uniref:polynucleotide adenylyltransferase n=1 Tax=Pseudocercospora fijiensis (strain CIRAD86) TaxID=383855 RepID=N1QBT1_PSEFD|nr:uncharacterized protein MYCFIDRAFT_87561 [Pseudocercospora fijiensis CIRAD86]EME88717.1 hypothetical protein MYCFIDRAFT_87561 [Pseudocercospora fijiensis CIRAD86]